MKSHETFIQELNNIIIEDSSELLSEYIEKNMGLFFATRYIFDYYQIIKDAQAIQSVRVLPRLIVACWPSYAVITINLGRF